MNLRQWFIAAVQITNGYTSETSGVLAEAPWRLRPRPRRLSRTPQDPGIVQCQVTIVDLADQQHAAFAGAFTGKTLDATFDDLERTLPGLPIIAIMILDYDEPIDSVIDRIEWWILNAVVDFQTYCTRMSAAQKQELVSQFRLTQQCIQAKDMRDGTDADPPPFYTATEQVKRGFPWDLYHLRLLDRRYRVVRTVSRRCSWARLDAVIRRTFPESKMNTIVYPSMDVLQLEPQLLLNLQRVVRTYAFHEHRIPVQQQALLGAQVEHATHAITDMATTP